MGQRQGSRIIGEHKRSGVSQMEGIGARVGVDGVQERGQESKLRDRTRREDEEEEKTRQERAIAVKSPKAKANDHIP